MKDFLAVALLFVLLFSSPLWSAEVADDCMADLSYLPLFLLKNDAGAKDHLARVGGGELSHAYADAQRRAARAATEEECNRAITSYLQAWRSGHLMIQPISSETGDRSIQVGIPQQDYTPRVEMLSEDTALLEIHSFHPQAGQLLQRELMKHRKDLEGHKNWIIDVRRNHGGSDSAYEPLLPWLLSGDLVEVQLAFLATEANLEATRKVCELYAPGDQSCIEFMKPILKKMEAAQSGSFVSPDEHEIEFIQIPESPYRQPERVAVLMGEACVSSCEQFLLTARQSFSVKLVGRTSKGNLDYSNLRPHLLPSGKRQLLYATSRSFRLPDMPVDVAGIMPDVYLPKPASLEEWDDEVLRVKNWLEGGSLAPLHLTDTGRAESPESP